MKYTQKKLDMKIDYQQRYGDVWEALYDQAILATPEYFDFIDLEKKLLHMKKPLMNEFMVHLPPLHVMRLRMVYSGLPNNYFATLNSFYHCPIIIFLLLTLMVLLHSSCHSVVLKLAYFFRCHRTTTTTCHPSSGWHFGIGSKQGSNMHMEILTVSPPLPPKSGTSYRWR